MKTSRKISLIETSDKDNYFNNHSTLNYISENVVNYLINTNHNSSNNSNFSNNSFMFNNNNNNNTNINLNLCDNSSYIDNNSLLNTTSNSAPLPRTTSDLFVLIFFTVGVFGNVLAIITLIKNQNYGVKQTKLDFFLRNLLANNFIALFGMLVQFMLIKYLSETIKQTNMRYFCALRVVWRYFGLSSGCCAFLMATDRWLSLAKPFFYQKRVTMKLLKRTLYWLWFIAALVTFSPLFGFGVYYNSGSNKCTRYRDANETIDLIYAYVFFGFGVFVCFGIVFCNIFVTRVLCIASNFGGRSERLMRYSENSKLSTTERKFIKLIIVLSISFVICWMPQMISIVLAQFDDNLKFTEIFFKVADILMSVHFGSDPYIYVLLRPKHRTFLSNILKQSSSKIQNTSNSFI